jgi:hypothetical protein
VAFLIENYVVRLEVPKNDVVLVQVLKGEDDLAQIHSREFLTETLLLGEGHSHVSARAIIQNQVQSLSGLEGIVQTHYKGMLGQAQHISLCHCIPDEILFEYLLLLEHLHGVNCGIRLLLDQVD